MKFSILLLSLITFSLFAQGQTATSPLYNEDNYRLVKQGADTIFASSHYAQYLRSNLYGSYTMKKTYVDSSFSQLLSEAYFKDSLQEGPFRIYNEGKIILQGTFKKGKWDGERLTYSGDVLVQKATFTEGVMTGSWEEYDRSGQLKRKITYSTTGDVVSDVKY